MSALMIAPKDVQQKPDSTGGGGDETENREARVAEDVEACIHAHQQGGADNEGGEDEAGRDAIGDFLETVHQEMRFAGLDVDVQLSVADGIENFVQARGQCSNELLRFQKRRKQFAF